MHLHRTALWVLVLAPAVCAGLAFAFLRPPLAEVPTRETAPADTARQATVDIAFQGRFVDGVGLPLVGEHDLYFKILDDVGAERYTGGPVGTTLVNGVATCAIQAVPVDIFDASSIAGSPYQLRVSLDDAGFTDPFDVDLLPTPFAVKADTATVANHATTADSATTADHATAADSATTADHATTAGDADTVDTLHASAFAPIVHTHTGADIDDGTITGDDLAENAVGSPEVADNSLTADDIAPDILCGLNGVTNDGGDIDLVPGENITITPDIPGNAITISSTAGPLPTGIIVMWSGSLVDIPAGWALCDGTDGTPDLTSRFIRSVPNASTDPGSTGGSPTHTHGAGGYEGLNHTHAYSGTTSQASTVEYCNSGSQQVPAHVVHTHTYSGTTNSAGAGSITGTSAPADSLPPYYELAFIMKT
ncbi:MAG TPA: hypothetical protein VM243_06660 [Phycisphaerae bacterium]|nr:hypothetical protein [Phycisphaerae bacterium]